MNTDSNRMSVRLYCFEKYKMVQRFLGLQHFWLVLAVSIWSSFCSIFSVKLLSSVDPFSSTGLSKLLFTDETLNQMALLNENRLSKYAECNWYPSANIKMHYLVIAILFVEAMQQ